MQEASEGIAVDLSDMQEQKGWCMIVICALSCKQFLIHCIVKNAFWQ